MFILHSHLLLLRRTTEQSDFCNEHLCLIGAYDCWSKNTFTRISCLLSVSCPLLLRLSEFANLKISSGREISETRYYKTHTVAPLITVLMTYSKQATPKTFHVLGFTSAIRAWVVERYQVTSAGRWWRGWWRQDKAQRFIASEAPVRGGTSGPED